MPSSQNSERKTHSGICVRAVLAMLLVVAACLPLSADQPEAGAFVTAGRKAPVLTLERLGGGDLTFPGKGQWTIVFFWSLFCHVCIEELPMLAEELATLPKDSVQAVFVSIDTARMKKGLENFLKKRNLDICVALDRIVASTSYEAADAWGVKPTPAVFLVDPTGTVTYSCEGPFEPRDLFEPLKIALNASGTSQPAASVSAVVTESPAPASLASGTLVPSASPTATP